MHLAVGLHVNGREGVALEEPCNDAQQIGVPGPDAAPGDRLAEQQQIAASVQGNRARLGKRDLRNAHRTVEGRR